MTSITSNDQDGGGLLPLFPELIRWDDDMIKTKMDPPEKFDFFLITQKGCAACYRVLNILTSLQNDTSLYCPAIVWYLDTEPRSADDINHKRLMEKLQIQTVPTLYLINQKQRIIPFPLIKVDGTHVRYLTNLNKEDIYNIYAS